MTPNYSYWRNTPDVTENDFDFFAGYDSAVVPAKVPAGTYIALLTGWDCQLNRNGKPFVKLSYRIVDGDCAGQIITEQRFLTAQAMGFTKAFFDSIGIDPRRSVADYCEIWVELVTTIQDGESGRQYANVQTVRRINPPAGTSSPAPGSSSQTPAEQIPGAF